MGKLILSVIVGLATWSYASPSLAEIKIGFVDVRTAVESTKAGKEVKDKLEKEFKKREKALKKMADDIQTMTKDFEKKSAVLSDKARGEKQASIQEEMMKYNQEVQKNTADIRNEEKKLMAPIFKKMQDVINELAKKEEISMVLQSRDNVLYATKEMDLTDRVVKAFEKK